MKYIEFTGKTVEEAVEQGLQELGLTEENADIRVLEEGKRKLFGAVKARVEIAPKNTEDCVCATAGRTNKPTTNEQKNTDGERAVVFLEGLFTLLNITACTELVAEGEKIQINVTAANSTAVIGKHGVMLDAIQTLAGAVANIGRNEYKRVVVDCENYRENRENTLQKLADNLAQKAIRTGRKIQLEPMNPYERRIIHAALADKEDVKTESEGKEPNRYIVIIPANLEDEDAPALPARTERNGNRRDGRGARRDGSRGSFNCSGCRNGGNKKGNRNFQRAGKNSSSSGGTNMKASTDFFGIFLGNSGNNSEE